MKYPEDFIGKIINADCLEVMKQMPNKCVDLVITDPPYGIKRDKGFEGFEGFGGKGKPIARRQYKDDWDFDRPGKVVFDEILRISENQIIFGGNFFADLLPQGKHWVVWDKLNTMPTFGDCELAWTSIPRNSVKKVTVQYNGLIGKEQQRFHPTQKPVNVMEWIISEYSEPTDIILDCFVGSGTTLVAAQKLHRPFIGIEISPEYCKIAEDRLKQQVLKF